MVVQDRGGLVENQEIDVVAVEPRDELRCQLRTVPESAFFRRFFIDENGDVQVAVGLRIPPRTGAEQIGFENLPAGVRAGPAMRWSKPWQDFINSSRRRV